MLTRTGRKILDHNLAALIRHDHGTPAILEEIVLDIHEYPQIVTQQIVSHRYFQELVHGVERIIARCTENAPRIAGNAVYILGALLESDNGREKVIQLLKEKNSEEESDLIFNLARLIDLNEYSTTFNGEIEAQTNASGTTALIFEIEDCRAWAFQQLSCELMLATLARCLLDSDMWVATNCALSLARICMSEEGRKQIMEHKESEEILIQLIMAVGVDNEGRGMNAAFAIAYLCDEEENLKKIAYMKECLDLIFGLLKMLRSVDEGCRKNAAFCLKTMSQFEEGQDRINDDPDIEQLLKLLCNMLTCGDEDLSKLASVILNNCATKREGYMLQKDLAPIKTTLEHVLKQMNISENYRKDAFEALKTLMIPKPEAPQLKVIDAYTIDAKWEAVEAKSGAEVFYELYCDDKVVYTGNDTTFVTRSLNERSEYEFRVRAFTDEDEESFISEGKTIQTFRAISSPPRNLRAVQVTSSQIKIVWEKPEKILGNLRGYSVQEQGSSIHYEPVCMYHFASNLEADREYTFSVCAVTQRGRGQSAILTVRTLRNDYFAPSKPKCLSVGSHEMVITWRPPVAPPGKINGYEVLCNGKEKGTSQDVDVKNQSIYFGMNKRCMATMLQPNTKYKFQVVAWTREGRTCSQSRTKKTISNYKNKTRTQPWKSKEELIQWLDSKDDDFEIPDDSDDDLETTRSRSSKAPTVASERQGDVSARSERSEDAGDEEDGSDDADDDVEQKESGTQTDRDEAEEEEGKVDEEQQEEEDDEKEAQDSEAGEEEDDAIEDESVSAEGEENSPGKEEEQKPAEEQKPNEEEPPKALRRKPVAAMKTRKK